MLREFGTRALVSRDFLGYEKKAAAEVSLYAAMHRYSFGRAVTVQVKIYRITGRASIPSMRFWRFLRKSVVVWPCHE